MKKNFFIILVVSFLFIVSFAKAQELTAVYPKQNFITADTAFSFMWNNHNDAINYSLIIANDASFTQIVKTINNIPSNYVFVNELSHGTYYWRVKANFSVGNPIFGDVYKISIFCPKDIAGLLIWLDSDTAVITHNDTVSEWRDLSPNNNNAIQLSINMQPIKINNIALLNFKSSIKFDGNDDFMSFNNISNIRTAFFLIKHSTGTQGYPPLLGHPTLFDWHGGDQLKLFAEGNTSNNIINGFSAINGQTISATLINKPIDYSILSFITTDNVSAQQITNDRTFGRFWNGNYSDILLFSTPLNTEDYLTVLNFLRYKYTRPVNLGFDIDIPYGFCDTTIVADSCFSHYIWNTGNPSDTLSSLTINNGGIYSVTATDVFGFSSTDTIVINRPSLILNDTTICQFSSAIINSHLNHDYTFLWSTTETDSFITVSNAGKYWLKVSDTLGCSITDTFYVSIDSFPSKVSLGPDISVCTGDSIRLVWGAQQAVTYLWNDNSTNAYLVINNPGTYWVTVTDSNNCIASDTIIVSIKGPLPSTNFISDSVCLGGLTHFTDQSSIPGPYTITEWHWNFGDGYFSDLQNPTHQYTSSGIYNVTLRTVSNVGCTRAIVKQVYVYSIPVADLIPLNGCNNAPIQFHDISNNQMGNITSWHWNFGDPGSGVNNESDLKDPVHTYITAGNYYITLIVASEAGCLDTVTRIINIRQSADVDFSFTEVCIENSVYFTDETLTPIYNSIISWHWDFGDGDSSSSTNPSHLYDTAGTYLATLTVKTLNGCEISISKPVTVYAKPIPDFVISDICALVPYQFFDFSSVQNSFITKWEWQIITLDTQYVQNPVFTFPVAGSYNVKLIVTTQAGCKDSISRQVSVFDSPEANFNFSPKYGIAPLTVNFTNYTTGGSSFLWNFGDESGTSILKNPSYTYTENGIYNIKLISYNQNNCYDSITKQIKIIPSSLDIAVKEVKTTISNNYLDISTDLINLGTRTIEELYLFIESNQGNNIRETWTGVLESGNQLHYEFSAEIPISEQTIDYICVRASVPDSPVDDNPSNDEKCKALVEDFILIDPYPNPTNGTLNVAYILPLISDVELNLYNSTGAFIKKLFSGEGLKGYNLNTFDFSKLAKGMYAIQIKYRDKVKVVKFVKE